MQEDPGFEVPVREFSAPFGFLYKVLTLTGARVALDAYVCT